MNKDKDIIIIGSGPAGLAAAYELSVRNGKKCIILEKTGDTCGLSKTVVHNGYRVDIGPHRFFTKNKRVDKLWNEVLPDDFPECPRLTRIYYNNIFFNYPLKASEIPLKLGIFKTLQIGMSYIKRHLFPIRPEDNFESWVRNRFGDRLYDIFFYEYTKKVWGVEPENINAEWASQRIRSLSLGKVIVDALNLTKKGKQTSLISKFHYPRMGVGQMYKTMAEKIIESGSEIVLNSEVTEIKTDKNKVTEVIAGGKTYKTDFVISSMPLDELALAITEVSGVGSQLARPSSAAGGVSGEQPDLILEEKNEHRTSNVEHPTSNDSESQNLQIPTSQDFRKAAEDLKYRSLVTVDLMFDTKIPPKDHWIYLNSSDVIAGRMNLFHNWSKDMVPAENKSCISLEYFCNENDEIWNASDEKLFDTAKVDISKINFMQDLTPVDQCVVKYRKAYPCYLGNYADDLKTIRTKLDSITNLSAVGRYGQFRYNNMDHSIETGLLAAEKVMGKDVDPWSVNEEAEYHEEGK